MGKLRSVIGDAAMLEQTAEECVELAHACLKLARYIRGENETYKQYNDLIDNVIEECADVDICISELIFHSETSFTDTKCEVSFNKQSLLKKHNEKLKRMNQRLDEYLNNKDISTN